MPTVTVYTAERIQEIEDNQVITNPTFFGSAGLTTSFSTLGNSWFGYDPANYDLAPMEWRLVAVVSTINVSDVLGILGWSGASELIPQGSKTATIANGQLVTTPWASAPLTPMGGYIQMRNATANRGVVHNAWLELRKER